MEAKDEASDAVGELSAEVRTPKSSTMQESFREISMDLVSEESETLQRKSVRVIKLRKTLSARLRVSDFVMGWQTLPEKSGSYVHVKTIYIDIAPYMWGFMLKHERPWLPLTMGECIGEVVTCGDCSLAPGTLVVGRWGWSAEAVVVDRTTVTPLAACHARRPSTALGVLGMPGRTAYYGLIELCRPQHGETVFVTAGASAVGSLVGQIAKQQYKCRVIGSAGSDEKLGYMRSLGFDGVFNYRTEAAGAALDRLAPDGIDCFFDNTGGSVSEAAALRLRANARVAVCGNIANTHAGRTPQDYARRLRRSMKQALWRNAWTPWRVRAEWRLLREVHLAWPRALNDAYDLQPRPRRFDGGRHLPSFSWEAFVVRRFDEASPGARQRTEAALAEWMDSGLLTSREDVRLGGLEDVPAAFVDVCCGRTRGKAVVHLAGKASNIALDSRLELVPLDDVGEVVSIKRQLTSEVSKTSTGGWAGICALDGVLYFAPHHATSVRMMDITTRAVSTLPCPRLVARGKHKYAGIAACDGKLYCSPFNAAAVLVIDAHTHAMSTIACESDVSEHRWAGIATVKGHRKLYCCPRHASTVLVIDTETQTTAGLPCGVEGPFKFAGITAVGEKLFCAPCHASSVLIIDSRTHATILVPCGLEGPWKWTGIAALGSTLYCCPRHAASVLVIDAATHATRLLELTQTVDGRCQTAVGAVGGDKWAGIAPLEGTSLLCCAPNWAASVLVIDAAAGTTYTIPCAVTNSGPKWHGACTVGDSVYCAPHAVGSALVVRPMAGVEEKV